MSDSPTMTWEIPCGPGTLHLGSRTQIMGILNVTPDSFSDGGQYEGVDRAVRRALELLEEGADILDIGGESTRPGSESVDSDEEMRRVLPVIERVRRLAPRALISVDTYKAEVAEAAVRAGAHMINDVWGFLKDPRMAEVAARYQVPTVLMHNQIGTRYTDLLGDIIGSLRQSLGIAIAAGLPLELTIIDPGVGFGKTPLQNLDLLRNLARLRTLGRPILLGTSRKSTIGKVLGGLPPEDRVEGTAATVALGIAFGADIVRVHDLRYMKRVATMTDAIVRPGHGGFTGVS